MRGHSVVSVFLLLWAMPLANTALCLPPTAVVQIEEDVYSYKPANNGAGPMWCHGSTCLVRIGDELFASGIETLDEAKPPNNCRWMLFQRGKEGWRRVRIDASGRTREPCPLAGYFFPRIQR